MLDATNESTIRAVMDLLDADNEELPVQDFIQTTPSQCRGEPLFLFLMMEAKLEEVETRYQTSLPI